MDLKVLIEYQKKINTILENTSIIAQALKQVIDNQKKQETLLNEILKKK